MTRILHVDSSSRTGTSVTRQLSKYVVDALVKADPKSTVAYRDLLEEHLPFASELGINASYTPPGMRDADQKAAFAFLENQANYLIDNDTYVFGVPMYNFTVPAVFKAFIDLFVVPGKTFSYENGVPKPLLKGKKVYVVTASGGNYDEAPMSSMDFLEPYMRAAFSFVGVTDMTFFKVQGHSEAEIARDMDAAKKAIDEIAKQGALTKVS